MTGSPVLQLGTSRALDGSRPGVLRMPAHHLVTHGAILGMTGSGKTGLLTVLVEEALRGGVPVLMIDVKGDLPNLLLAFSDFDGTTLEPPPHPASPPTKRPLVALMKQARAFGVGVLVATQNPMDLDYRALGNAGLWCVGRLQTDADRERVVEGLSGSGGQEGPTARELAGTIKRLAPRWFVVRDAHAKHGALLLQPRWAMSFMRGPMTGTEIRRALTAGAGNAVLEHDDQRSPAPSASASRTSG